MQSDKEMAYTNQILDNIIINVAQRQYKEAENGISILINSLYDSGYQRKWYERGWYQPSPENMIETLNQAYLVIQELMQQEEYEKAKEELEHLQVSLRRNWNIMKSYKDRGPIGFIRNLFSGP